MLTFGPISSLFDFLTFGLMLGVLHAGPMEFRTGWFVESLGHPDPHHLRDPHPTGPVPYEPARRLLTLATFAVVAVGVALTFLRWHPASASPRCHGSSSPRWSA